MRPPLAWANWVRSEVVIPSKARGLLGILTTLLFAIVGMSFVLSGRYGVGGVLLVLAALRGAAAFQQIARSFEADEDPSA